MPKAGPVERSVSKPVRQAGTAASINHHANAVQAPCNAPFPHPHTGHEHRLHSDEIVIGLALGSPRQSSILATRPGDRDVDVSCVCSSPEKPVSPLGIVYDMGSGSKSIKRKGSKWKSLGNLFGRREVRSASSLTRLDQKQQSEPAKQFITQDQLETNALRRKRADSGHGRKEHRVDSFTGMPGEESSGLLRRFSSRRRGLRRRKVEEPRPQMQRIPGIYTARAITENSKSHEERPGSRVPCPPLLQVEIPCVELERYSVMFGDVLKPQARQSKPQPSLLARRQAHLEELHTAADSNSMPYDTALRETSMRADSIPPKSSKSPSFSLFPSTPPHSARSPMNKLLLKPSPLSRSSTEPGRHLVSEPATKGTKSQDQDHMLVIVHSSEDISETPTSHARQPRSSPSQHSAHSTTASFFECAQFSGYSYPPVKAETATPTEGAPHEVLQRAFPVRKSSMKTLASPESRYRHQGEDPVGPAAEVSVAREISISRRQRQLLVPIAPKTARQRIQLRVNEQSITDESRKSHYLTLEDA